MLRDNGASIREITKKTGLKRTTLYGISRRADPLRVPKLEPCAVRIPLGYFPGKTNCCKKLSSATRTPEIPATALVTAKRLASLSY